MRKFMMMAVEQSELNAIHRYSGCPNVGAVIVTPRGMVARGRRGEFSSMDHAESILLVRKLANVSLKGAHLFTTLEPCTDRQKPGPSCCEIIIKRGIKCVSVAMLNPDPVLSGRGISMLRSAGLQISYFAPDLIARVQQSNSRHCSSQTT